jgi:hypothetical protein
VVREVIMDLDKLLKVYRAVRRLYLYNNAGMVLNPLVIADALNKSDPKVHVKPSDVLAAIGYGMILEDRFDFDVKIKYIGPGVPKTLTAPAATFTFAGIPVNKKQVKQISRLEKKYGQIKFKEKKNLL